MKFTTQLAMLCLLLFWSNSGNAQDSLFFTIDLPISEYPYNWNSKYATASMDQSVKLTKSFYYATHFGIELFGKKHLGKNGLLWSRVIMTIFDFAPIPLSNTWLHEEQHRSVLSLHGVKSRNTYWANSVVNVKDEDLIQLKLLHPSDMVREATAGNEGNLEFVLSIEKDVFFNEVNTWNYGLYWGNYLVNSFYLFGSTRKNSKPLVKFKNSESTNIHERDVNGFDPVNATYDLFNPNASYTDRGTHPSGEGIDRYVENSDLSPAAQQFLKNQFAFSLVNFLDLNLFGINELGKNTKYNISVRHHMTSFGYMLAGNLFFKTDKFGGFLSPKFYRNNNKSFLGLDVELRNNWAILRLAGWQQPKNQLYNDTGKRVGGLLALNIAPTFKNLRPYVNLTLKSKGWVAGNLYLDENLTIGLGVRWRIRS